MLDISFHNWINISKKGEMYIQISGLFIEIHRYDTFPWLTAYPAPLSTGGRGIGEGMHEPIPMVWYISTHVPHPGPPAVV